MRMTLAEIAAVTGGRVIGAEPSSVVTSVVIDSRSATAGSLFVALPGSQVDGHDFAAQAVVGGAMAVLASRPVDAPHVLVTDPIAGLGAIASAHRRAVASVVVGITGSSGKTGTKDLIARLLSEVGPTVASPGSYNNDIGLPMTVLSAPEDTRFLVLEMGARGHGHIARLCAIAEPEIGVVVNVGSAHLGEFGSRDAIAQAKGELIESASRLAVLNANDAYVAAMAARARGVVRTFGMGGPAGSPDVAAHDVSVDGDGRASFVLTADGRSALVALKLVGPHHVMNATAAATVALDCGLALDDIARVLTDAEPASRWRMEMHERNDGVTVINDAYNANPESMRAALDTLAAMGQGGRRTWAALGPMLELGETSDLEHEGVGRYAAERAIAVVAVDAPAIAAGAGADALQAKDIDEAAGLLEKMLAPGDVVLLKASRGARFERLADRLLIEAGTIPSTAGSA